jgi:ActR/RegA family two-component response regulator
LESQTNLIYFIRNTQEKEKKGQIIQQNSTFFTILRRTFENCSVAVALRRTFFATASQATHVAPTLIICDVKHNFLLC